MCNYLNNLIHLFFILTMYSVLSFLYFTYNISNVYSWIKYFVAVFLLTSQQLLQVRPDSRSSSRLPLLTRTCPALRAD